MSRLAQLALLALAAVLQVTLIGRLDPTLPQPNLVLALVLARAWLRGGGAGMRWALAGGLLLDLFGTGPLGAHALALLVAAYGAGWLAASFETDAQVAVAAAAGAAGGALYGMVLLALVDALGLAQVSVRAAAPLVVGGTLTAAALVPPAVAIMARIAGRREVALSQW